MPKITHNPENGFYTLLEETNSKIKLIRKRALDHIKEEQSRACLLALRDLRSIGWKWSEEDVLSDGQFEQLEQSVINSELRIVNFYENSGTANIADSRGMYKVTGEECGCADFIFNGVPCKHMYFLAGIILNRRKQQEEKENSKK